jgi:serine beta-lactamase-like protein LACTB
MNSFCKRSTKVVLLFVGVVFLTNVAFSQSAETLAALKATAEKQFPSLHAPGMSAAVSVSNKIVWSQGFGVCDLHKQKPADAKTIYRYASISKSIAAVAVMQLVEQGKVKLDVPVQTYVPSFPKKSEGEITLRHLMTHTSGIRHYRGLEMYNNRRYNTVEDALRIFQDDELQFKPGEKYQYSSYGYNILAAVVEKASGKSFRAYLKEKIFQPAGMADADLEFLEELVKTRTIQYVSFRGDFRPAPTVDLSCKWAGGGMAGTAEDLVRFCMALNERKLLSAHSCEQMYRAGVLNDGSHTEYGLGWRLKKDSAGRRWVGHSGGATGGTTHFLHNPENKVAVAVLTNADDVKGLDKLALQLGEMLLSAEAPVGN